MKNIEERLTKLEQSMRLWRMAAIGLGLLVVAGFGTAASNAEPQDLVVRSLTLKNPNGFTAAEVKAEGDAGVISLWGKSGSIHIDAGRGLIQVIQESNSSVSLEAASKSATVSINGPGNAIDGENLVGIASGAGSMWTGGVGRDIERFRLQSDANGGMLKVYDGEGKPK